MLRTITDGSGRCCRSIFLVVTVAGMLAACAPTETTGAGASSSSSGMNTSGGSSGQNASGMGSSSGPKCDAVTCTIACQWGFAAGPDGCLTCSCLPDPRACNELSVDECGHDSGCALVTFNDQSTCCTRLADGSIRCSETEPPPTCRADDECRPGQLCNTWDYCEPSPGCMGGGDCPAVCYGRCVPRSTTGQECASDYDCASQENCVFAARAVPCDDPNSGACPERYLGTCQAVVCPDIAPYCEDGSQPIVVNQGDHQCPTWVCGGACETLPPGQCELRADCEANYAGGVCDCACATGEMCDCACPAPAFSCQSRSFCFSDDQCDATEFCDFTYAGGRGGGGGTPPPVPIVAQGRCIPRSVRCEGLPEEVCVQDPTCRAIYGEVCEPCEGGSGTGGSDRPIACGQCSQGFVSCKANDTTTFCSRDLDCGPGFRCNTCPVDPTCPNCDVCGPPVCEEAPVERCTLDADCGPGRFCRIEACTDSFPPSCVGVCEGAPNDCGSLDERTCRSAPGCEAIYTESACNDGCHDSQGRLTSCGPCLAVACATGSFSHCQAAQFDACCSDAECGFGSTCQFLRDANLGECIASATTCGGSSFGDCPRGSSCTLVGSDPSCSAGRPAPSDDGSGAPAPPPGCPLYECIATSDCGADMDCGPGMYCNTCPAYCDDPAMNCPEVCGAPRCEARPENTCSTGEDCAAGCACRNGTCVGADDGACMGRTFRVCTDDTQCLPDEYCDRCPPGAACFVADHCAPRERPYRECSSDTQCLDDEHCGTECAAGTMCNDRAHCVLGAPSFRTCHSSLECRPDEYCQQCPPGAACFLADHCEPRTFRQCQSDTECLSDERCTTCPPGATCIVAIAPHCEVRPTEGCTSDGQCRADEHCEMCPEGAMCLVANRCVRD